MHAIRAGVAALCALSIGGAGIARADAEADLLARAREAAQRHDAPGLVRAMLARYRGLATFAAEGEIVNEMALLGQKATLVTRYTVRVAKPDRYRVTWATDTPLPAGGAGTRTTRASGAVWNAGDGPFNYTSTPPGFAPASSDEVALAMGTGVSGGAAQIPNLVLGRDHGFSRLESVAYQGEEEIDGEPCWIVSASSAASPRHVLWISMRRLVMLRHRWSQAMPDAADLRRKLDPESMDRVLRELGLEATPEVKERMAAIAEAMGQTAATPGAAGGEATETVRHVAVDAPLAPADLAFTPPAGTPRKHSLLDGMLGGSRARPAR